MYSTRNSLKVFVSNNNQPTVAGATVADLPIGEIGFFTEDGVISTDGIDTGFFAWRKSDGQVIKSKTFTFAGWSAGLKAYAAPTLEKQTITISTATAGETYQARIEMKLIGMQGEYFKHGNYVANSSDTTSTIATALAASLNAAMKREGKSYFTITAASNVITIEAKLLPYVRGKKRGHPAWFKSGLVLPHVYAVAGVQTVSPTEGIGYGPYICEQEFLAQGDSDALRFEGYPNSFDDRALVAVSSGKYNVAYVTIDDVIKTANNDVRAPQQYIIAFNTIGTTVAPTITTASDGDLTVTGTSAPNASVILYVDGVAESAVSANGSGAWSVTVTVAEGDVLTATAQVTGAGVSNLSVASIVTA